MVNREDIIKAEETEFYYGIPADSRDLNYDQYFSKGQTKITLLDEYHSHNTRRLNVEEMMELLCRLLIIKRDVLGEDNKVNIY